MQAATKDNSSMASNSGQRAARRRRIDDVRQLQQERRRQSNNKQSQLKQNSSEQRQQQIVYEMQDDYVNTGNNHTGGYHSDANTTQSSRSARSSSIKSPGGASTHSTRSSLSAKRKNMMQRRIENRKRIEQRKAMEMQKQLSQEEELDRVYNMQHQQQQGGNLTVHHNSNQSQQSQSNTEYNQPQHYTQQPYNTTPQGYSNAGSQQQSIMKNNSISRDYEQQQQQQRRQLSFDDPEIQMSIQRQRRQSQSGSGYGDQQQQEIQRGPSRSQEQQYYNNPNQQAMPPLMSQPQRPPMQPHYQTPQNNNIAYYNTQQQQQQLHNHSQLSSPRVIPSPPTVQRNNAASHPYPYDNHINVQSQHHQQQHTSMHRQPVHLMGEHSFEELEQSGIIRNNNNNPGSHHHLNNMSRNSRQPIMNRNHMAPSDEWDTSQQSRGIVNGYNSEGGGQQHSSRYNQQRSGAAAGHYQQPRLPRQPQSSANNTSVGYNSDGGHSSSRPSPYNELRAAKQQYQMEQQRHQRRGPPPLMSPPTQLENQPQQPQHYQQPRRSSPPRRASPPRQAHGAVVSHFMRNHPSMQQGNSQRQQRDISPQKQHAQPPQNIQPPPQQQQQQHSQPNWNEVNRQRMYQRQAVSKQQYQERQEHLQEQQQELEKMEEEQRELREKSRSPNRRKKNIIPDSPVEHLGVRTDKIQRKNNIIVHHHANTAPSSASGGRQRRHPLPQPPDDETISVASLRKGWEKSHSPADSKHTSRSRNTAPPSSSGHRQHDENSPFGVWTERSERLLRARRREQRREQRKNIEDRWRSNFRGGGAVQSLPSSSQRQRNNGRGKGGQHQYDSGNDYGYQSEGERGGQQRRPERYDDGYQSEGQELVRSRNRYYDDREPAEEQHQEEVEYNPDQMMFEEVPDTITPQDARARLWDQNERLRAVLPQNEMEGMGNVKDRWLEHRPGDSVVSPRSNFSGSSGGRFKSKFVHAAAIATQQRAANMNESNRGASYSPQRSQRHQQQRGNYEVSLSQHENLRRRDSSPHKRFNAHKGSMAVLSHYTDSTAETTTLDTNPSRSFGSSQRHQVSNTSTTVRRVSPSPKSSSGQQQQTHPSSMMPPIAEQRASSEVGQSQVQNTTSVAALISRINAVSRSNPEEALAAIDSIIKTQHNTSTDTGHAVAPTTQQEVPPTPVKIASLFSPTRNETPPIVNNARNNKNKKELHVGKDFFQQKYEEVLHSDSLQVIRDANAAVVRDRASFDNSPVEEEDDYGSFLSSEDSTVSSMTNPTYQSRRDHEREQKHRHQKKARSQEEPPDVEQKKSWNTLKREYNARKNSPVRGYSEEEELEVKHSHSRESRTTLRRKTRSQEEAEQPQVKQTMTPSDEEDIGLDKFSAAIQDEPDEDSVAWRQQIPLVESKDLSTGMCGMAFTKSGSKYSAAEDNSDLVDNNAWVSHDAAAFGNTGRSRKEAQSKHRQDKRDPRSHPPTAPSRKLDNYLADNRTSSSKKAQISHQSRNSKLNKRASPPPLEQPPKARASTPEIMKSMSDAFSNLDISLEATTARRPSQEFYNTRPSQNEEFNDDPPLQTFESDPEDNQQSLKSISEAFSDVGTDDIFAQQEKTTSQRRKQLEYLAKSWTADSSSSPNFNGGKKTSLDNTFAQQHKATEAADWAKETFKSNNTSNQPSLRLKGNKSLASKFASLVKAYDD